MSKPDKISSLISGLENLQINPSPGVWKKINRRLAWRDFTRFEPATFNVYYLILVLGILSIGLYLYLSREEGTAVIPADPTILETTELPVPPPDVPAVIADTVHRVPLDPVPEQVPDLPEDDPQVQEEKDTLTPVLPPATIIPDTRSTREQLPVITEPRDTIPLPIALFSASLMEGCVPLKVNFFNHSLYTDEFMWSFGDGGTAPEKAPAYVFDEPGTYIVSLTALSDGKPESVYSLDITVHDNPVVRFEADIQTDQPVYFYNYSRGASEYFWDFGDGNTSTMKDPSHVYLSHGDYDIKLVAVSSGGCMDSMIIRDALREDEADIRFPTAFSPVMTGSTGGYFNGRERNHEVFYPYTSEQPVEYLLRVFNRAGMLVFESTEINIGWDGYHRHELQPAGVYVWKVRARFENGRTVVRAGDVTLMWGNR